MGSEEAGPCYSNHQGPSQFTFLLVGGSHSMRVGVGVIRTRASTKVNVRSQVCQPSAKAGRLYRRWETR